MKTFTTTLLLALLLGIGSLIAFADSRDWSLQNTKGEKFTLSDNLGQKPIILVFWATWCTPCKKELDEQRSLFESLTAKGAEVILVAVDNQKSQARVKPYVESKGYKWTVLMDPDQDVLKRYGGINVPFTIVLDKNGDVKYKARSAIKDAAQFETMITGLME